MTALQAAMKPNPHDALVRYTFKNLTHARGLLKNLMPMEIAHQVNWKKLALEDGSFIDPQLAERQTDLLYRAPIHGRDGFIYVLLEHQSSSDPMMALRILVYLTRIWQRELHKTKALRRLPVIVPLVLHHSASGWSAPTSMNELYDAEDDLVQSLGDLLPQLRFQLTDLTRQEDDDLHLSLRKIVPWLITDRLRRRGAFCLFALEIDAISHPGLPQGRRWQTH